MTEVVGRDDRASDADAAGGAAAGGLFAGGRLDLGRRDPGRLTVRGLTVRRHWPVGSRWRGFAAAAVALFAGVVALGTLAGCSGGGAAFVGSVPSFTLPSPSPSPVGKAAVMAQFSRLKIRSAAAPAGYSPDLFGKGWGKVAGSACSTDNFVFTRDLTKVAFKDGATCVVLSGALFDPYTGQWVWFERTGPQASAVGIDHVVSLADAWASGLYQWNSKVLRAFADDPEELVAASAAAIAARGGADASAWLPPNVADRCAYVARQVKVKATYYLTVTQAEHDAMAAVLTGCPQSWPALRPTSAPPPPPPPSSAPTLQARGPATATTHRTSAQPAAVAATTAPSPSSQAPSPSPAPSPLPSPTPAVWPAKHTPPGWPTASPSPTPPPDHHQAPWPPPDGRHHPPHHGKEPH